MTLSRAYRAALRLYPRSFRREYGDDMVALVDAQLRDEGATRVIGRAVVDLLTTVPIRHMEAHMSRTSTTAVVVVLTALGVALAVVGGVVGLAAGAAALALAGLTWWRNRRLVGAGGDVRWRKLLVAGVVLLVAFVVVTTTVGELPDGTWYLAMAALLTSIALIVGGVVLGIASRSRAA